MKYITLLEATSRCGYHLIGVNASGKIPTSFGKITHMKAQFYNKGINVPFMKMWIYCIEVVFFQICREES